MLRNSCPNRELLFTVISYSVQPTTIEGLKAITDLYIQDAGELARSLPAILSTLEKNDDHLQKFIDMLIKILMEQKKQDMATLNSLSPEKLSALEPADWKILLFINNFSNPPTNKNNDLLIQSIIDKKDSNLACFVLDLLYSKLNLQQMLNLLLLTLSTQNIDKEHLTHLYQAIPLIILGSECQKTEQNLEAQYLTLMILNAILKHLKLMNSKQAPNLSLVTFTTKILRIKMLLATKQASNEDLKEDLTSSSLLSFLQQLVTEARDTPLKNITLLIGDVYKVLIADETLLDCNKQSPIIIMECFVLLISLPATLTVESLVKSFLQKISAANSPTLTIMTWVLLPNFTNKFNLKDIALKIDCLNTWMPAEDDSILLKTLHAIFVNKALNIDYPANAQHLKQLMTESIIWPLLIPRTLQIIIRKLAEEKLKESAVLFINCFELLKKTQPKGIYLSDLSLYLSVDKFSAVYENFTLEHRQHLLEGIQSMFPESTYFIDNKIDRLKMLTSLNLYLSRHASRRQTNELILINSLEVFLKLSRIILDSANSPIEHDDSQIKNLITLRDQNFTLITSITNQLSKYDLLKDYFTEQYTEFLKIIISQKEKKNDFTSSLDKIQTLNPILDLPLQCKITKVQALSLLLDLKNEYKITIELSLIEDIAEKYHIFFPNTHTHAATLYKFCMLYLSLHGYGIKDLDRLSNYKGISSLLHTLQLVITDFNLNKITPKNQENYQDIIFRQQQIQSLLDKMHFCLRVANGTLAEFDPQFIDHFLKKSENTDLSTELVLSFNEFVQNLDPSKPLHKNELQFLTHFIKLIFNTAERQLSTELSLIFCQTKHSLVASMGEIIHGSLFEKERFKETQENQRRLKEYHDLLAKWDNDEILMPELKQILNSMLYFQHAFMIPQTEMAKQKSFEASLTCNPTISLTCFSFLDQDIRCEFINETQFSFFAKQESLVENFISPSNKKYLSVTQAIRQIPKEDLFILELIKHVLTSISQLSDEDKRNELGILHKNLSTYNDLNVNHLMWFLELHHNIHSWKIETPYAKQSPSAQKLNNESIVNLFKNYGIESKVAIQMVTGYYLDLILTAVNQRINHFCSPRSSRDMKFFPKLDSNNTKDSFKTIALDNIENSGAPTAQSNSPR